MLALSLLYCLRVTFRSFVEACTVLPALTARLYHRARQTQVLTATSSSIVCNAKEHSQINYSIYIQASFTTRINICCLVRLLSRPFFVMTSIEELLQIETLVIVRCKYLIKTSTHVLTDIILSFIYPIARVYYVSFGRTRGTVSIFLSLFSCLINTYSDHESH